MHAHNYPTQHHERRELPRLRCSTRRPCCAAPCRQQTVTACCPSSGMGTLRARMHAQALLWGTTAAARRPCTADAPAAAPALAPAQAAHVNAMSLGQ